MSPNTTAPHDPSVADYRATSPYEWGGITRGKAYLPDGGNGSTSQR
jgi:hypothetical protein